MVISACWKTDIDDITKIGNFRYGGGLLSFRYTETNSPSEFSVRPVRVNSFQWQSDGWRNFLLAR